MLRRGTRFLAAVMATAAMITACSGGDESTDDRVETDQMTFEVTEPVTSLEIEASAGNVDIVATDDGALRVDLELRFTGSTPEVERTIDEGRLVIRHGCRGLQAVCAVDYHVRLPAGVAVTLDSGSGDVAIDGLTADVIVQVGSGDLTLTDLTGDVTVHSGSGNITVTEASSALNLQTSSGNITGLRLTSLEVDLATSSGHIEVSFEAAPSGFDARTRSGHITVKVPKGVPYRISATALSGTVHVEVPTDSNAPRSMVITTSSGNVEILEQ
ncbi:MAG: DUF4097 domain-containing protein [Acidimicrobiia bacterium]